MIETICFNPLLIPYAIKLYTLTEHCCQIPAFPRTSASQIPWVSSPGWWGEGWGSKLILLLDHNRHLNLKELKKRKYLNGAKGFYPFYVA